MSTPGRSPPTPHWPGRKKDEAEAKTALDDAEDDGNGAAIAAAQKAVDNARAGYDAASVAAAQASQAQQAAQTAYDNTRTERSTKESQGSLGFLQWLLDNSDKYNLTNDQINDLKNGISMLDGTKSDLPAWVATDVSVGKDGDATSLTQMKNALSYLDEVNAIRNANGLKALGISFSDTALAEINADYSGVAMTHSRYGGSAENIAWYCSQTYANNPDGSHTWPYTGLYDSEKEIYICKRRQRAHGRALMVPHINGRPAALRAQRIWPPIGSMHHILNFMRQQGII